MPRNGEVIDGGNSNRRGLDFPFEVLERREEVCPEFPRHRLCLLRIFIHDADEFYDSVFLLKLSMDARMIASEGAASNHCYSKLL